LLVSPILRFILAARFGPLHTHPLYPGVPEAPELFILAPEMDKHMYVFASVDEADVGQIRTAQKQKVPFMLIAGEADASSDAVSFRYRDGEQRNGIPIEPAVTEIVDFVARRVNESPTSAHFES